MCENGERRYDSRLMRFVAVFIAGQLHKSRLSATVPSRSAHQTSASGLHDPHPAVDFRPVVQSKRSI